MLTQHFSISQKAESAATGSETKRELNCNDQFMIVFLDFSIQSSRDLSAATTGFHRASLNFLNPQRLMRVGDGKNGLIFVKSLNQKISPS